MIFFETAISLNVDWKVGDIILEKEEYKIEGSKIVEYLEGYKSILESSFNYRVKRSTIEAIKDEIILSIEGSFEMKFTGDIEVEYHSYTFDSIENDELDVEVEDGDENQIESTRLYPKEIVYEVDYSLNYRDVSIDLKWGGSCFEKKFNYYGDSPGGYPRYAFENEYELDHSIHYEYHKYVLKDFIGKCLDQYLGFNVYNLPEPFLGHPLESKYIMFVIVGDNIYYILDSKDRQSHQDCHYGELEKVFLWKYGVYFSNNPNGYASYKDGKFVVDTNMGADVLNGYKKLIANKFGFNDDTVYKGF